LRIKNQEQQLDLEISTAVRAVETNYQRALAYRAARELAQKKLEAEQEKFKGRAEHQLPGPPVPERPGQLPDHGIESPD